VHTCRLEDYRHVVILIEHGQRGIAVSDIEETVGEAQQSIHIYSISSTGCSSSSVSVISTEGSKINVQPVSWENSCGAIYLPIIKAHISLLASLIDLVGGREPRLVLEELQSLHPVAAHLIVSHCMNDFKAVDR